MISLTSINTACSSSKESQKKKVIAKKAARALRLWSLKYAIICGALSV